MNNEKLQFIQVAKKSGYHEYRLAELIRWLLATRHTPDAVKREARLYFDHYNTFMKFDNDPYGIKANFENEKVIFTRELTGELWGIVQ